MIKEHERVVLTAPVPAEGLEAGDVGTVVHVYRDGLAYEVEFITLEGKTAAVVTLEAAGSSATAKSLTPANWRPSNMALRGEPEDICSLFGAHPLPKLK